MCAQSDFELSYATLQCGQEYFTEKQKIRLQVNTKNNNKNFISLTITVLLTCFAGVTFELRQ